MYIIYIYIYYKGDYKKVGWWWKTNPSGKTMLVKLGSSSPRIGVNTEKYLTCHDLVDFWTNTTNPLKLTANLAPENRPLSPEVFPTSIFRSEHVSFREGTYIWTCLMMFDGFFDVYLQKTCARSREFKTIYCRFASLVVLEKNALNIFLSTCDWITLYPGGKDQCSKPPQHYASSTFRPSQATSNEKQQV